jgi:hypothetical protein
MYTTFLQLSLTDIHGQQVQQHKINKRILCHPCWPMKRRLYSQTHPIMLNPGHATSVLLNEFNMQGQRQDMRNIPAWQR